MDVLSAIKLAQSPGGLSASSLLSPGGAQDVAASVAKTIPQSELQQLTPNSDMPLQPASTVSSGSGAGFENMLGEMVNDVAAKQAAASGTVSGLLSGQNVSLHQAMISMEEANVSFQMMVEVRNRLLDGYQELMRMQI